MGRQKPIRDQRKSFRCAVAEARQSCELKVGPIVMPASLVDESSGGYAVVVDRPTGLDVNQTAELRTDAGWYAVRVVHITKVQPRQYEGVSLTRPGPWYRLGLRRLGEAAPPDRHTVSLVAGSVRYRLGQWCPSGGVWIAASVLFAIIVVAVPIGLMGMRYGSGPSGARRLLHWNDQLTDSVAPGKSPLSVPFPGPVLPSSTGSPFPGDPSGSWTGGSAFQSGSSVFWCRERRRQELGAVLARGPVGAARHD